jgi:hypothetical protein
LGGERLLNGYMTDFAVHPGAASALLAAGGAAVAAWQAAPHLCSVLPVPRPIARMAGAGTAYEAIWGLRSDLNTWLAPFAPLPSILAPLAVGAAAGDSSPTATLATPREEN